MRYGVALLLLLAPAPAAAVDYDFAGPDPAARRAVQNQVPVTEGEQRPSWSFDWGGYLHVAYRWIQQPTNYNLAGRTNGFQLEQARLVGQVQFRRMLTVRISLEGASEDRLGQSFEGGQITARLRDAYVTWAPLTALRVSVGQMVTPWDLDGMRSDAELPFVSRSVASEGVQASEGFTRRGMGIDRSLGIALHSGFTRVGTPWATVRYALLVANGNTENQLRADNNTPAVYGRGEVSLWGREGPPPDRITTIYSVTDEPRKPLLHLGVAAHWRRRTGGNLPDLVNETDTGAAADLAASAYGVEVQAGLIYIRTTRETLGASPDVERFGLWGHVRWMLPKIPLEITPGYRIASYAPRAHLRTVAPTEMDARLDDELSLLYHTFGVTVRPTRTFPVRVALNYTLTVERGNNVLSNDRFEANVVAVF